MAGTDDTGIIEIVAANVRRARKQAGLSQEQLAHEAGFDRTYVSQGGTAEAQCDDRSACPPGGQLSEPLPIVCWQSKLRRPKQAHAPGLRSITSSVEGIRGLDMLTQVSLGQGSASWVLIMLRQVWFGIWI
jgi:hypothetical protein